MTGERVRGASLSACASSASAAVGTFIKVLVLTGEAPAGVCGLMDELLAAEDTDLEVIVVSGSRGSAEIPLGPRATLRLFPGESVFDLRRRIPMLAGEARWVILLEGHNKLEPGWQAGLRGRLASLPESCDVLLGHVENLTSAGVWSWASFLHTFAFHWRPDRDSAAMPSVTNIAVRGARLPARALRLGEFEFEILPGLMATAAQAPGFAVDHVQHLGWASASLAHWCNGRVTGAMMAGCLPRGSGAARRHARAVVTARLVKIESLIGAHPARHELPAGTLARVRWLALCHAAGALWGGRFGPGRAAERLV
jgi:hypothetical protein